MIIEILDKDGNVLMLANDIVNPELQFQTYIKDIIPNAYSWRGYIPPELSREELLDQVRIRRDKLLAESDWTQMPDSPLTTAKKTQWKKYRQALRDLTETVDPLNPVWPQLGA